MYFHTVLIVLLVLLHILHLKISVIPEHKEFISPLNVQPNLIEQWYYQTSMKYFWQAADGTFSFPKLPLVRTY